MNGVAIWQYSDYGGQQDLNVDLTGITNNGYTNHSTGSYVAPKVQKPVTPKVSKPATANGTYVVQRGDSWWAIANKYGLNMYSLASLNGKSITSVIYPGQVLKVKATASQNQPKATSSQTWRDSLGDTWHHEKGTFTSNTWINLRWGARQSSSRIALLAPNSVIHYDAWSNHGGYIWVRQPRGNGQYGYLVVRNATNHEPFGWFK